MLVDDKIGRVCDQASDQAHCETFLEIGFLPKPLLHHLLWGFLPRLHIRLDGIKRIGDKLVYDS